MKTIVRVTIGIIVILSAAYIIVSGTMNVAYLRCLEEPENVCSLDTAFIPDRLFVSVVITSVLTLLYIVVTIVLGKEEQDGNDYPHG